MVLQDRVAAAACLLTLATACGKGPGPSESTPPGPADGTTTAAVERSTAEEEAGGATPEPRPADEEELHVDGVRLRLQPAGCLLTAKLLDEELEHQFPAFPGPCHFAPDRQGQPWIVATEHGKAVVVESSATGEDGACDTALQVVVITERGPQLSREIQRVSACGPGPWDEMMYHVLASDRVALGAP